MTPTPLQMKQLIAAGGIAGDLCEYIQELEKKVDYQAKTIKIADECMKEKQETIDWQKIEISRLKQLALDEYSDGFNNGFYAGGGDDET